MSLLRDSADAWWSHNAPRLGAALAFYTVLSLAPLLLILFTICSFVFGDDAVRGQIFWRMRGVLGDQASSVIQLILKETYHPEKGLVGALVGIPVLLFGASGILAELRSTLNYIWDYEAPSGGWRQAVRYRLATVALVPALGALMLVGFGMNTVIEATGAYISRYYAIPLWFLQYGNLFITLLFVTATFALVYRFFPAQPVDWREALIGAVVTALMFLAGNLLVLAYVTHTATGSPYGAAGSLVVFLVWVYYSSQIFLFGAEITHVYAAGRRDLETKVQTERR